MTFGFSGLSILTFDNNIYSHFLYLPCFSFALSVYICSPFPKSVTTFFPLFNTDQQSVFFFFFLLPSLKSRAFTSILFKYLLFLLITTSLLEKHPHQEYEKKKKTKKEKKEDKCFVIFVSKSESDWKGWKRKFCQGSSLRMVFERLRENTVLACIKWFKIFNPSRYDGDVIKTGGGRTARKAH